MLSSALFRLKGNCRNHAFLTHCSAIATAALHLPSQKAICIADGTSDWSSWKCFCAAARRPIRLTPVHFDCIGRKYISYAKCGPERHAGGTGLLLRPGNTTRLHQPNPETRSACCATLIDARLAQSFGETFWETQPRRPAFSRPGSARRCKPFSGLPLPKPWLLSGPPRSSAYQWNWFPLPLRQR
jgi:hypothetical protein